MGVKSKTVKCNYLMKLFFALAFMFWSKNLYEFFFSEKVLRTFIEYVYCLLETVTLLFYKI